jgi:hypothetical protein
MPYCVYIFLFVSLLTTEAGDYLAHISENNMDHSNDKDDEIMARYRTVILTVSISILWLFFAALEATQIFHYKFMYL